MYLNLLVQRILSNKKEIDKISSMACNEDKLRGLKEIGYERGEVIKEIEDYFSVKYIDLNSVSISEQFIDKFGNSYIDILKEEGVFVFEEDGKVSIVSGRLPNREVVSRMKKLMEVEVFCYFAFDYEIAEKINSLRSAAQLEPQETSQGVDAWLSEIISFGAVRNASDIHIESKDNHMSVRYRIDGLLGEKKIYKTSESDMSKIYVKIKIMSGLDISEKRKPQDGRMSEFIANGRPFDIRVSTVLTVLGEKIVLRLIDKSERVLGLDEIGFSKDEVNKIKDLLDNQNGIIYVSGPTGSGKTTSLYGMIDYKNSDGINLYTIEDPVERGIEDINQISVNVQAGVTYASTLRALLRQDPDVIVIGEVRDEETAELASRGSLAGHLIIATVHANSSTETLARLNNLGLDNYSVGTTTLGVISQRLVRVLCDCKRKHVLTDREKNWIKNNGFKEEETYEAVGCSICGDGYAGRTVIAEILEVNEDIGDLIMKDGSLKEIRKKSKLSGFRDFKDVAYEKAVEGRISLSEAMTKSK